jgi:hypothetical protein
MLEERKVLIQYFLPSHQLVEAVVVQMQQGKAMVLMVVLAVVLFLTEQKEMEHQVKDMMVV